MYECTIYSSWTTNSVCALYFLFFFFFFFLSYYNIACLHVTQTRTTVFTASIYIHPPPSPSPLAVFFCIPQLSRLFAVSERAKLSRRAQKTGEFCFFFLSFFFSLLHRWQKNARVDLLLFYLSKRISSEFNMSQLETFFARGILTRSKCISYGFPRDIACKETIKNTKIYFVLLKNKKEKKN